MNGKVRPLVGTVPVTTSMFQNAWVPSTTVAPMTITFSGPETALMTLPNGRTTALKRHRF